MQDTACWTLPNIIDDDGIVDKITHIAGDAVNIFCDRQIAERIKRNIKAQRSALCHRER